MNRKRLTHVRLRIERLTLDGVTLEGAQARRFSAALETELARLLSISDLMGVAAAAGATPSVAARDVTTPQSLTRSAYPPALGGAVAHSLFEAIGGRPIRGGKQP
jgi:hypothetical protein